MEKRIQMYFDINSDLTYFKVLDQDENVIMKYEGEAQDIAKEVIADVETFENGKYQIWGGKAENMSSRTAKKLPFTIGNQNINRPKQMAGFYSKEDLENAYNQGVKDARINTLEKRIDMLEKRFDKLIEVVSEFKDELDGNNDNDLLSKVMNGAGKIKEVKDVLGDF